MSYRQSLRFKRHGIDIPETTMCDWVSQSAMLLQPLVELMRIELLTVPKIHTDETPVPVLAKGKTKQGRLWVYVADGISCHPCTIYDYTYLLMVGLRSTIILLNTTAVLPVIMGRKNYLFTLLPYHYSRNLI